MGGGIERPREARQTGGRSNNDISGRSLSEACALFAARRITALIASSRKWRSSAVKALSLSLAFLASLPPFFEEREAIFSPTLFEKSLLAVGLF